MSQWRQDSTGCRMTYHWSVTSAPPSSPASDGDTTAECVDKYSAASVAPLTSQVSALQFQ